jgi:hypothetical protein
MKKIEQNRDQVVMTKVWITPTIIMLSTQFTLDVGADCANLTPSKVIGNEDALTPGGTNVCGTIPTS